MARMPVGQGPATAGQVFSLIRDGRAVTRSEVGRVTGLSRTAVAARVAALLESGLVVEGADPERAPSSGGRPPVRLRFDADAGVVLAGAIGRSRTQLAVCDLDGTVLAGSDLDQEVGSAADDLMPQVVAGFTKLLDADDPRKVLARSAQPILEPVETFERTGLFNETIFSCGHVELGDGRIRMYYGAADSVVAAADFDVRDIVSSLEPWRGAAERLVRV